MVCRSFIVYPTSKVTIQFDLKTQDVFAECVGGLRQARRYNDDALDALGYAGA